jgi:hypothetical protein
MTEKNDVKIGYSDAATRKMLLETPVEELRDDADGMAALDEHRRALRGEGKRVLSIQDPAALVEAVQNFCTPAKLKP